MIKLIHGDCIEEMRKMPDKSVDLVLTDPPYGMGMDKKMHLTGGQQYGNGAAPKKQYKNTNWDIKPSLEIFDEMIRISVNQIIFGAEHLSDLLPQSRGWIVWDKKTDDKFSNNFSDGELAWTSFDKPLKILRYLWSGMIQGNMSEKEKRQHPTQKPQPVMSWILRKYSSKNDTILDPFMGSGTTGVACKELCRDFIGIEINKEYFNIAKKRIDNTQESFF